MFFRFLRTHPKLRYSDFLERKMVGNSTWEFVSFKCRIIIILQDSYQADQQSMAKAEGYQILAYSPETWLEFPDVVAEDIAQISSYQSASHS